MQKSVINALYVKITSKTVRVINRKNNLFVALGRNTPREMQSGVARKMKSLNTLLGDAIADYFLTSRGDAQAMTSDRTYFSLGLHNLSKACILYATQNQLFASVKGAHNPVPHFGGTTAN